MSKRSIAIVPGRIVAAVSIVRVLVSRDEGYDVVAVAVVVVVVIVIADKGMRVAETWFGDACKAAEASKTRWRGALSWWIDVGDLAGNTVGALLGKKPT